MIMVTHLWQSPLCAGAAALLVVALKRSSARTRHAIWALASLKFLLPFSLLVLAGRYAAAWVPGFAQGQTFVAGRWLDQSLAFWNLTVAAESANRTSLQFGDSTWLLVLAVAWAMGAGAFAISRWRQWRAISRVANAATLLEHGREIDAVRRLDRGAHVPLLLSDSNNEPGVIGVLRPRLLWPAGLSERLSDAELESVLSHELCHIE